MSTQRRPLLSVAPMKRNALLATPKQRPCLLPLPPSVAPYCTIRVKWTPRSENKIQNTRKTVPIIKPHKKTTTISQAGQTQTSDKFEKLQSAIVSIIKQQKEELSNQIPAETEETEEDFIWKFNDSLTYEHPDYLMI